MDQQELGLKVKVVPTGEASYRYDPAETNDGVYFAMSYRRKRVCVDSGLLHILNQFVLQPADLHTFSHADSLIADFLKDYTQVWWKHPRTGEFLELVKLTTSAIRTAPVDEPFTPRQLTKMVLTLSPHYKVPNDQSMGSAPLHVS